MPGHLPDRMDKRFFVMWSSTVSRVPSISNNTSALAAAMSLMVLASHFWYFADLRNLKARSPPYSSDGRESMNSEMKRVLVNGAGGFIGGHLVKRLRAEGNWVRAVDLKRHEFPSFPPTNSSLATSATRGFHAR